MRRSTLFSTQEQHTIYQAWVYSVIHPKIILIYRQVIICYLYYLNTDDKIQTNNPQRLQNNKYP